MSRSREVSDPLKDTFRKKKLERLFLINVLKNKKQYSEIEGVKKP